jgi:hypothetical protein
MEAKMGEVSAKQIPCQIPASDMARHLDPDDPSRLCRKPYPDPVQQLDMTLEMGDDVDASYLWDEMITLEIYLTEPYAISPGGRDAEGIDVTEYPFA